MLCTRALPCLSRARFTTSLNLHAHSHVAALSHTYACGILAHFSGDQLCLREAQFPDFSPCMILHLFLLGIVKRISRATIPLLASFAPERFEQNRREACLPFAGFSSLNTPLRSHTIANFLPAVEFLVVQRIQGERHAASPSGHPPGERTPEPKPVRL